jgi:lipopolysaccharide transport system permease protein
MSIATVSARDTVHLRSLVWTLVRTDFKSRYHGTAGGFLWALMRPLFMFLVLMAVFSYIFASRPRYSLDLVIGLFLWDFFSEATKVGLMSLQAKAYLLTKARFPSWVVVVASSSNAALTLLVFMVAMVGFLAVTGHPLRLVAIPLFCLYALLFWLIATGISLASSVLFLQYRDLNQVWDVVSQAGFFIAPIVYPLDILPERVHFYLYIWPPTPVIQFSRAVLVDQTIPTLTAHLMLLGVTTIILVTGIAVFAWRQGRAIERL